MPTDNADVTRYIEDLASPHKEICEQLRALIGDAFADLDEVYAWSRPVYRSSGAGVCYLVANKKHVNLGFDHGSKLDDPRGALAGTGVNKRHIKIRSVEELDLPYYSDLLRQAIALDPR